MEYLYVVPELIVLGMACAVLLAAAWGRDAAATPAYVLAQLALAATLVAVLALSPAQPLTTFHGAVIIDGIAAPLKAVVVLLVAVAFVYARHYFFERGLLRGEFFALGLFALLGMMVLISANSLLTLYLGLELMSLSLYAMVAMHRHSPLASEAAMKYFFLGALSSGLLLYGISLAYGASGALALADVAAAVEQRGSGDPVLLMGVLFFIVGVGFKLGVVPFHMWLPDVYEGAPTASTLFIAAAPKISGFALAVRLLVDAAPGLVVEWQNVLAVLAALSIGLGNTVAIAQTNIKRMLAYSTIAHMGYLLLGLVAGTLAGYAGAMFYAIVYALMSIGAFGLVVLLGRAGFESDRLEDFAGLARRSPWFALVMLILMFSMAGVPPLAGFWGKWFVIKEAIDSGFVGLAVVAVVFSIVGAYYYLRVVKLMYFDEPAHAEVIGGGTELRVILSANGLAVLALGLLPGALMGLCLVALRS